MLAVWAARHSGEIGVAGGVRREVDRRNPQNESAKEILRPPNGADETDGAGETGAFGIIQPARAHRAGEARLVWQNGGGHIRQEGRAAAVTASANLWIPAFAGMTGQRAGMTDTGKPLDALTFGARKRPNGVHKSPDSRFRGNDGVKIWNDSAILD